MNKYDKARYHQIKRLVNSTISSMGSYSERAVNAIMMIIAHESKHGTLREQVISFDPQVDLDYKESGKTYAAGIVQMERPTHDDLWANSDNIHRDYIKIFCDGLAAQYTMKACTFERLIYDDKYSIFMARKKLHMITEVIPSDLKEMSEYLVKYYNAGGSAKPGDYLSAYLKWTE